MALTLFRSKPNSDSLFGDFAVLGPYRFPALITRPLAPKPYAWWVMSSLTASWMYVTSLCYFYTHTHTRTQRNLRSFRHSAYRVSRLPFCYSSMRGQSKKCLLSLFADGWRHNSRRLANYELINIHIHLHMNAFSTSMRYYIYIRTYGT